MSFHNSDESDFHTHSHDGLEPHSHDGSEPHDHSHEDAELSAQKEQLLKRILMPDARRRLNNIKMVKPAPHIAVH